MVEAWAGGDKSPMLGLVERAVEEMMEKEKVKRQN
jgi:hypothetical protein